MENTMGAFLEKGKSVERAFCEVLKAQGYDVVVSSVMEDMKEHWDVMFNGMKVDVKGLKKVTRRDEDVNENFHWLELVNVRGEWGSVYGKADLFAFESEEYWILVEKKTLHELIKKKCVKQMVAFPTLYRMYQRSDRKDILTLVKTIDLMRHAYLVLDKSK
jgi:hypothetical protein